MPRNRVNVDNSSSRCPCRIGPLIDALEERLLFSLGTMVDATLVLDGMVADSSPPVVHHAPLAGGETGGNVTEQAPDFVGFDPVILGEDANDYYVDLSAAFQDPSGGPLHFELLTNDNPELFEMAVVEGNRLKLDVARDAFGDAILTVRAITAGGDSTDAVLPVYILPMNDRPTTTGFQNVVLDETQTRIIIDLFAAFEDIEDPDHQLTYTVTKTTHPELFESITIDPVRGQLILLAARGVSGISMLTVRATDTEGAYVEMSTAGANFPVYDEIRPEAPNQTTLGLQEMNFISDGLIYVNVNGVYNYNQIDETRLRDFLRSPFFDPSLPTVFNIENEEAGNHPAGREIRAQVMRILWEERPNAEIAGFYGFMPDRSWFAPVGWRQSQEDIQRGLFTNYTQNAATNQQRYADWQAENAVLRTAPLQDGSVLSDYVTVVYPSLYTFYRAGYASSAGPTVLDISYDGDQNRFTVTDSLIQNGTGVDFNPAPGVPVPDGFRAYTTYFVVNSDGRNFQLASEIGGEPINLTPGGKGAHFLYVRGPRDYMPHDPEFLQWRFYAEEMIAEARLFNVSVVPWISGSMRGTGTDYMDENFFRHQLDTLFELADGITVWDHLFAQSGLPQNQGWFRALSDFMAYIRTPTEFQVTVNTLSLSDGDIMRGDDIPRMNRFDGLTFAFASGTRGEGVGFPGALRSGPTTGTHPGSGDQAASNTDQTVRLREVAATDPGRFDLLRQSTNPRFASRLHPPLSMSARMEQMESSLQSLDSMKSAADGTTTDPIAGIYSTVLEKFGTRGILEGWDPRRFETAHTWRLRLSGTQLRATHPVKRMSRPIDDPSPTWTPTRIPRRSSRRSIGKRRSHPWVSA